MPANALLEWVLFLALAGLSVAAAGFMIITMSMYRAGLTLMVSFLALAGLFFLLDAELLGIIQIMMNVGGMLVMILFMVMLMMDPGGQMMWEMKREMHMSGLGALSMRMPRGAQRHTPSTDTEAHAASSAATGAETTYTCPMHPEARTETPGTCPKCGMALVPVRGETEEHDTAHAHDHGAAHTDQHDMAGMAHHGMDDAGTADMEMSGMTTPGTTSESHESDSHQQMMVDMAMSTEQLPLALVLGAVTALGLSALVLLTPWPIAPTASVADATQAVGSLLMSKYMMGFEGAAMLILAGIAGAVILGRREPGLRRMPATGGAEPAHDHQQSMQPHMHHAAPLSAPSAVTYTCPMHPEIRQHEPGICPKCSMPLVPVNEPPTTHGHDHAGHHQREHDGQHEHDGHHDHNGHHDHDGHHQGDHDHGAGAS